MPRTYALSTLRTRCRRRADLEGQDKISPAEWDALISEQYGELFDIVTSAGLRHFEKEATITATGATSYVVAADHGKTVGLDRVETDGTRHALRPLMVQERTRYGGVTGDAVEYALVDDQVFLYPKPGSGTYKMLYIAQATDITTKVDADLIDVVCNYGEAFLIWGVAVKALSKMEADVRLAMAERDRNAQKLLEWAIERDANEPRRRVVDDEYDWPRGDPSGWWNRP